METPTQPIARLAYTIREVTSVTGLSKSHLHKLFNEGLLTRRKIGKRTFVLCEEVNTFLESRPTDKWRGGGRKA